MIGSDGIGNVLHQNRFTGLRLSYDERTLSFAYRGEKVYDAGRKVGGLGISTKCELFFWEEWGEMLKRNAVSYF